MMVWCVTCLKRVQTIPGPGLQCILDQIELEAKEAEEAA